MNKVSERVNSFQEQYPDLGVEPMPIDQFFTPAYYELEKERVFKKSWLQIGLTEEIPNSGDYFVKELQVCDTSLLIVRGADGKIRAFHNMCSHRSNRVAYEKSGNTKTFKCRFHAWTYGLDGALIHLPEPDLFPDFDPCDHGLTQVACDTWHKFIFVNVDPSPAQTLREYIGPEVVDAYDGYFDRFKRIVTFEVEVQSNWKTFLDAFAETYHFSTVHAASAGDVINTDENPDGFVSAMRLYDKHRAFSVNSNVKYEPIFPEKLTRQYSGGGTIMPDLEKGSQGLPLGINPLRMPDWSTDVLILFPMANFQPLQGFHLTQAYWPLAHDRTRWEFSVYMLEPKNAAEEVAVEFNRAYLRDVVREDLNNLEMIQANLASGAKSIQMLGDQEIAVRHAYDVLAKEIGAGW